MCMSLKTQPTLGGSKNKSCCVDGSNPNSTAAHTATNKILSVMQLESGYAVLMCCCSGGVVLQYLLPCS